MGRSKAAFIISVVCAVVLFAFNNCGSDMEFSDSETAGSVSQSSAGAAGNDEETAATDEQIQEVIDNLTEEELMDPIPVAELETDPSLFDKYKCDASSVMICHFPENILNAGDNCIGIKAVYSHFSHIREYVDEDGQARSVYDYLGPCR